MDQVNSCYNDRKYMYIVSDILENKKFLAIKECKHHGINRLEHSMRVSYYSYKITKKLRLNYKETARGSLLHDFFKKEDLNIKKQKLCFALHPYLSLENACNNFDLSALEKDIICIEKGCCPNCSIPVFFRYLHHSLTR